MKQHPEKPIASAQLGPFDVVPEDGKLLTQSENFEHEFGAILEEGAKEGGQ